MIKRIQINIEGIVQGVGFRPFVFTLAKKCSLGGFILNDTRGVYIEIEGEEERLRAFISSLQTDLPPLARIERLESRNSLEPLGSIDFRIRESVPLDERFVLISPDIATCQDCLNELFEPRNRRYKYPFVNCTNCGPRFTIIKDIPYDREKTTMRRFGMCALCQSEYEDPLDRRFHAQPNACSQCGPRIFLTDRSGNKMDALDALYLVRDLLKRGNIVAIKGIGGFHLACDALNTEAVANLRRRKHREAKPFAMMARDVEMIKRFCLVSAYEEELLRSQRRPIVLLRKRPGCEIPEAVAPNLTYLGFMLPYTPLHHLLLEERDGPLVMTSGNLSDEPIAYTNEEALGRLNRIADAFLLHDREIHVRCDDSVTRAWRNKEYIIRRARGYVPHPVKLPFDFEKEILACGAELKNTFCLTHRDYAFVSHHIGDLEHFETLRSFEEGLEHFKRLFYLKPEVVAYDLHPEYLSTKYALALDDVPVKIGVQHHHAHIASCMADNGVAGEVIGVAMDGLGFGTDGKIWGCEFLIATFRDFERVAHLRYVPMPGGANAITQPWRMAAVYLHQAFGEAFLDLDLAFTKRLDKPAWKVLRTMASEGINSPLTSSVGRLFDAVASLLGVKDVANYEGEAAIELEAIADGRCADGYHFELAENESLIEAAPVITGIANDLLARVSPAVISAKFHNAVADLITRVALKVRAERKLNKVVLSGGVFQNMFLLERAFARLQAKGFEIYTHRHVPTNDGGISLGQVVVANARIGGINSTCV